MTDQARRLAAIDVGTNSIHLVVASVDPKSRRFRILDREKEIVRLGKGPDDMKLLSEKAMERGIETLKRFKRIADAARAPVRAIATSAVREAENRKTFTRRVKRETGIDTEIISGVEEARLIYLGVLQALPVFNKRILLIDIGGGSTEFLVGKKQSILYDNSLKLGAIRLTERFFHGGTVHKKSVSDCRKYIRGSLNPVSRMVRKYQLDAIVGSSGTILSIAKMIQYDEDSSYPTSLNAQTISRKKLFRIVDEIVSARTEEERSEIKGLDPARADIIVAGALILEQIFEEFRIGEMIVSEFALREGTIFDSIEKLFKRGNYHNLYDIRYNSVLDLAESFRYEREHSHRVAKLSLQIFDRTKELHHLGEPEREYLEAAAILHEIGLFLSHENHHVHSYYLIRNAELLGFNENEKEIIANVARYHRKGHPRPKHEGFGRLSDGDQAVVRKLASILRIADGLDRTHSGRVAGLRCTISKKRVTIRPRPSGRSSIDLETWGANRKKELFESTFGTLVKISAPAHNGVSLNSKNGRQRPHS